MFLVPLGETSINFDNYVAQNNLSQSHGSVPDLSRDVHEPKNRNPSLLLSGISDHEQLQ